MQQPICHVVAAAPGGLPSFELAQGDMLIAADGGYAKCLAAGLAPQLVIGDFDSLEGGAPRDAKAPLIELPRAKDDTDLLAAVRCGLERGYRSFALHCALGGDLGHSAAAIRVLAWLRARGCDGYLDGAGQVAAVVVPQDGMAPLSRWAGELPIGCRVSVFAFGGAAEGVVERGLVWELDGAILGLADSIGVSNEVAAAEPVVRVENGRLLVVVG